MNFGRTNDIFSTTVPSTKEDLNAIAISQLRAMHSRSTKRCQYRYANVSRKCSPKLHTQHHQAVNHVSVSEKSLNSRVTPKRFNFNNKRCRHIDKSISNFHCLPFGQSVTKPLPTPQKTTHSLQNDTNRSPLPQLQCCTTTTLYGSEGVLG